MRYCEAVLPSQRSAEADFNQQFLPIAERNAFDPLPTWSVETDQNGLANGPCSISRRICRPGGSEPRMEPRAHADAFVQDHGKDFARRMIGKAVAVQALAHPSLLIGLSARDEATCAQAFARRGCRVEYRLSRPPRRGGLRVRPSTSQGVFTPTHPGSEPPTCCLTSARARWGSAG